jgi:hypothetical protein
MSRVADILPINSSRATTCSFSLLLPGGISNRVSNIIFDSLFFEIRLISEISCYDNEFPRGHLPFYDVNVDIFMINDIFKLL